MPSVFRNALLEPKALVKPAARYLAFSGTNIAGWHLDLPPPRHKLPHWVNKCDRLVKAHSTPRNVCLWLHRGRTLAGGAHLPHPTWQLEHSFRGSSGF